MTKAWMLATLLILSTTFAKASVPTDDTQPTAVPNEYILELKSTPAVDYDLDRLSVALEARVLRRLHAANNLVVVEKKGDAAAAINELRQNPLVAIAEPNYIYRIHALPNDPAILRTWGIRNIGQLDWTATRGLRGIDVDAERAWDITTGSRNVVVAVIDTGVNYTHSDLAANMWKNAREANGVAGVDDDGNGFVDDIYGYDFVNRDGDPKDDQSHGSHVSGTIGGVGNDGTGIVGVNWKVSLMAIKFLGRDGSGTVEGAVEAIDYAVKMGAHVINASWGGPENSQLLANAIARAGEKNVTFVAAAGNSGKDNDVVPHFPSNHESNNIIAVAALNNTGRKPFFSNWGARKVHIAAPGEGVYSSIHTQDYDVASGTSMATPHVVGAIALLLAKEPRLTPVEIRDRMIRTARPLKRWQGMTVSGGLVNAYNMLMNAQEDPDFDTTTWPTISYSAHSPHPYPSNARFEVEINVPGAKRFSIHFAKARTEQRYDIIQVVNRDGAIVDQFSGMNDGVYSEIVGGDYAKVVLISDAHNNDYGFEIDSVAVRK